MAETLIQTGIAAHEAKVGDLTGNGLPDIVGKPYNPQHHVFRRKEPAGPTDHGGVRSVTMIELVYGTRQQFRYHHGDINILGHTDGETPVRLATWRLNSCNAKPFLVKHVDGPCPARNRLGCVGDFNIEIPVSSPDLIEGDNQLLIEIEDAVGQRHVEELTISWTHQPVVLPLDLSDLSGFRHVQEIGQVVNGAFDLDPGAGVIRSRSPVARDALVLLGSPHGAQEATYGIRFLDTDSGDFIGLSDFFAGHEADEPDVGIKPGWSSAGLATVRPGAGGAQAWLAWGDLLKRQEVWGVKTDPPVPFAVQPQRDYRVRHQVTFENGVDRCRFRIWPADEKEGNAWLCEESDAEIASTFTKFTRASFGLFQNAGMTIEWFDIRVRPL